jgi:hypothetical protein
MKTILRTGQYILKHKKNPYECFEKSTKKKAKETRFSYNGNIYVAM